MEFRHECGRCHRALSELEAAYHCAQDCTFCATCYRRLNYVCPNCSGELVRRPRPTAAARTGPPSAAPPGPSVVVRPATVDDVGILTPLFDAYRVFYEQPSDPDRSGRFLRDRLARAESVVLIASSGEQAVGFVQLYPLFSSVSLGPVYVLNDLYVVPSARRHGVGAVLLEAARSLGESTGAHYLELSTAVDNPAQRLYESLGWVLDREFLYYERPLPGKGAHGGSPAVESR
jgi:GNAT superfamily N-acetyltransferase